MCFQQRAQSTVKFNDLSVESADWGYVIVNTILESLNYLEFQQQATTTRREKYVKTLNLHPELSTWKFDQGKLALRAETGEETKVSY